MFSDIIAWVKPEEPEDYVPAPVVPKKKGDYVVGMNICSLWREGSHAGWTAFRRMTMSKRFSASTMKGFPKL